jgi:hypothetical protein
MPKKIYEVRGTVVIEVLKRVKAHNEEQAMELAENLFGGITAYCGNGGTDKLIGVDNDSESIEPNDYVEWKEANETDDDRYDEETEDEECTYICKLCGEEFYCENANDYHNKVENELLEHLEFEHEEEFEECQAWYDPDIVDEFFDVEEN